MINRIRSASIFSILSFFVVLSALAMTATAAAKKDIVDTAVDAGSFNTLAAALQAADLVDTLKGDGPYTVFAPTDEAFAKLPDGTVETLLMPENKDQLVAILTYHVVPGTVTAEQVVTMTEAKTVNGAMVEIAVVDGTVKIDEASGDSGRCHDQQWGHSRHRYGSDSRISGDLSRAPRSVSPLTGSILPWSGRRQGCRRPSFIGSWTECATCPPSDDDWMSRFLDNLSTRKERDCLSDE